MAANAPAFVEEEHTLYRQEGHRLVLSFHDGQRRAWAATKRLVVVLAGAQSGKTCFGPLWLWREMRKRGPGHYMAVSSNYSLMLRKMLPEFLHLFHDVLWLGEYQKSEWCFVLSDVGAMKLWGYVPEIETRVFFGYAEKSDSLESSTAKAIWSDEAGLPEFKLESFEALERRGAIYDARHLITTTLYNLGWVVEKLWRPWKDAGGDHPDIDLIRFESIANPAFSREVWDRLRASLPAWKFDLLHRAIPTRPAGSIYDSFDRERHTCPPFRIPDRWERYLGLDFGAVNTAALFYAKEPGVRRWYLYREYHAGGRTAAGHVDALLRGEPFPVEVRGGSKSEKQWRTEFRAAGLPIKPPAVPDSIRAGGGVEVGIDRVWGMHAADEIVVFDSCEGYLEEKQTYRRKLDDRGDPTEEIEDKHAFHFMDAERYIMAAQAESAVRDRPPRASRARVTA